MPDKEMFTQNYSQEDLDNLADLIWWIKGYHKGAEDNHNLCDFQLDHAESLRKARVILLKLMKYEHERGCREAEAMEPVSVAGRGEGSAPPSFHIEVINEQDKD